MLALKDVSFGVMQDGVEKKILQHVDLEIPENKLIVITGPNGGGKSTLAKIIAGISFAFQQPVRFKGIRVLDLIRMAVGKTLSVADACEYLSAVGLCARNYIDREVNASLSGGELKRIEIATVIARATKLSVFDEPEAGIDLWSFQNLIQVFRKMREKTDGGSILIISHQERILSIADEIIVLRDGMVEKRGSKEAIYPSLLGTTSCMKDGGCKGESCSC